MVKTFKSSRIRTLTINRKSHLTLWDIKITHTMFVKKSGGEITVVGGGQPLREL